MRSIQRDVGSRMPASQRVVLGQSEVLGPQRRPQERGSSPSGSTMAQVSRIPQDQTRDPHHVQPSWPMLRVRHSAAKRHRHTVAARGAAFYRGESAAASSRRGSSFGRSQVSRGPLPVVARRSRWRPRDSSGAVRASETSLQHAQVTLGECPMSPFLVDDGSDAALNRIGAWWRVARAADLDVAGQLLVGQTGDDLGH